MDVTLQAVRSLATSRSEPRSDDSKNKNNTSSGSSTITSNTKSSSAKVDRGRLFKMTSWGLGTRKLDWALTQTSKILAGGLLMQKSRIIVFNS